MNEPARPGGERQPQRDLPEGLLGYDQQVGASAAVPTSADHTLALLTDLSRLPEWLTMHGSWRGAAPSGAALGVTFTEQVFPQAPFSRLHRGDIDERD